MASAYSTHSSVPDKPSLLHIPTRDELVEQKQKTTSHRVQPGLSAMDEMLKAHNMHSASARRKRMQARLDERDLATRRHQEQKRRIVVYDDSTELIDLSDAEQDSEDQSDTNRREREWSLETPSEYSILTPDEPSAINPLYGKQNLIERTRATPIVHSELVDDHEVDPHEKLVGDHTPFIPPSPGPMLQASLVALADFNYERFSTIMDSPPGLVSSPELDSDSGSAIETATPVSYRQPITRPSVISIINIQKRPKRKATVSTQSPLSQESEAVPVPPPRSRKRISQANTLPAFLASEATPMQVPDLPANAVNIIANASKESLGTFTDKSESLKQRKSSMPFLSEAFKNSHDKMNSLKNLVKSPTQTQGPSFFRPSSSHHRPMTANMKTSKDTSSFETLPSFTSSRYSHLTSQQRPQTARTASTNSSREVNVTALPNLTSPQSDVLPDAIEEGREPVHRKKSFSMFRRRSGSLGQAIKSVKAMTAKSPTTSESTPEMPSGPTSFLMSPESTQSDELSRFPSPPIPSPRSRKSFLSFSNLAAVRNSGSGPIGLGLRT